LYERPVQLKTSSLFVAFTVSYAVKLLISNLFDHPIIPFQFVQVDHFLILLLAKKMTGVEIAAVCRSARFAFLRGIKLRRNAFF
jgi:hypothetical protein